MKLTVYRYKVWDPRDDEAQIPLFLLCCTALYRGVRGTCAIEGDFLQVDQSHLDVCGRIFTC